MMNKKLIELWVIRKYNLWLTLNFPRSFKCVSLAVNKISFYKNILGSNILRYYSLKTALICIYFSLFESSFLFWCVKVSLILPSKSFQTFKYQFDFQTFITS